MHIKGSGNVQSFTTLTDNNILGLGMVGFYIFGYGKIKL